MILTPMEGEILSTTLTKNHGNNNQQTSPAPTQPGLLHFIISLMQRADGLLSSSRQPHPSFTILRLCCIANFDLLACFYLCC
jgi:hypothetical protein